MKANVEKVRATFRTYHSNHRNIIDKNFRENGLYFGQPPILKYLSENDNATQKEIADFLGIKSQAYAITTYVTPLVKASKIKLSIPDRPRSPEQRYTTIQND